MREVTEAIDPLLLHSSQTEDEQARFADEVAALFGERRVCLTRLAAAVAFDRSLAEKVVQEAFLGLQRRMGVVDNAVGYLQRSVVNLAVNVLRHRKVVTGYLPSGYLHRKYPRDRRGVECSRAFAAKATSRGGAAVLAGHERSGDGCRSRMASRNADRELEDLVRSAFAEMMPQLLDESAQPQALESRSEEEAVPAHRPRARIPRRSHRSRASCTRLR